jgi:hypothetical protein
MARAMFLFELDVFDVEKALVPRAGLPEHFVICSDFSDLAIKIQCSRNKVETL